MVFVVHAQLSEVVFCVMVGGEKRKEGRRDLYNDVNHTLIIVLFVVYMYQHTSFSSFLFVCCCCCCL